MVYPVLPSWITQAGLLQKACLVPRIDPGDSGPNSRLASSRTLRYYLPASGRDEE